MRTVQRLEAVKEEIRAAKRRLRDRLSKKETIVIPLEMNEDKSEALVEEKSSNDEKKIPVKKTVDSKPKAEPAVESVKPSKRSNRRSPSRKVTTKKKE